ncbi:NAD(FAD)-dependent dehydrogenase [Microvirga sp. KLBC 81]|uniref:(2Fe-2S)-binding protein n=1 Tax=Microvirga sp. KLBC 81 TaxID=1862707 RepID=UPI000D520C42|nr:(2Fe-2S)-binding protein [Microvirga sp. KLBC 81]PVE24951.1 NAD(FAD)-dependent dehydrogenase [Microvirga sp. KLBC 81]
MPDEAKQTAHKGQFVRVVPRHGTMLRLTIDGNAVEAVEGDSLLAVLLLNGRVVRHLEFGGEPRAGFCLMGACQDCWVSLEGGERVRACTTLAADGMVIWTNPQKADADA